MKQKADLTAFHNTPTPSRRKTLDFLKFFIWQDGYRMVVPKPKEKSRLFAFLSPFEAPVIMTVTRNDGFLMSYAQVWYVFVISLALVILLMWLMIKSLRKLHGKKVKEKSTIADYSMYTVNVLTNHGNTVLQPDHFQIRRFALDRWLRAERTFLRFIFFTGLFLAAWDVGFSLRLLIYHRFIANSAAVGAKS